MKTDREKRPLVLRRTERGLEPRSREAQDMLAEYPVHSDVEITVKKRRSLPQLRLYWAMLHRVCEATEAFPSAEHLHDAVKMELGYTTPCKLMDGSFFLMPDSAAMSRMNAPTFKAFFDSVVKLLAETYGIDPLEGLEREAA